MLKKEIERSTQCKL